MTQLSAADLTPHIDGCDIFQEFFELPNAANYRRTLNRLRGWKLAAGDTLPAPSPEGPAYVVLAGKVSSTRSVPADAAETPIRILNSWTAAGDAGLAMITAVEDSVVLECPDEVVRLFLNGAASRFKVEYYAPLVCRSPFLAGIPAEALDTAIRQSKFIEYADGGAVITEGDFGSAVYFLIAGCAEVILPSGPPRKIEAGDFFGEVAYVSRQKRTATVRAVGPALAMECRPHAIAKLLRANRAFKDAMDERYRAYGCYTVLSAMELFAGMASEELRGLCGRGTLETFFQYEPVFFKGDPADALYVILNGTVTLVDDETWGTNPEGWLHAGAMFGEMALFPKISGSETRSLTVTALQRMTAIRFSREEVGDLVERYPSVGNRILSLIEQRRAADLSGPAKPGANRPLEWVLDTQFLAGNHVLAVDLDNCIRCNNCVTACESTHLDGRNRFFWSDMREETATLPRVSFSTSCQHCESPLCLEACPQNCIERSPETGAVHIDYSLCTRCGVCADPAQGCPYGSIYTVPKSEIDPEASLPLITRLLRRFTKQSAPSYGPERQANNYPVKCDLCRDLPFQACVEHCPTGAVFRVSGRREFARMLGQSTVEQAPSPRSSRTVYLNAEFAGPPAAGKFAALTVRAADAGPGIPIQWREPENGSTEIELNLFLIGSESVEVQGGRDKAPLRRLRLTDDVRAADCKYNVKAAKPGPQELTLCVYQGGLYLGRTRIPAEFVAAAPPPARKPAVQEAS
ncbi:MAG: cyclic nucleotide-binding domain-containing protein [Actinomycetota bacterium]